MTFRKLRHDQWQHVASGVIIERGSNPNADRKYYVQWSGDDDVCRAAFAQGCAGGFFRLASAKAAIESASAKIISQNCD